MHTYTHTHTQRGSSSTKRSQKPVQVVVHIIMCQGHIHTHTQVVAVRKGLKNQFKSWGTSLFGKSSSDSAREGVMDGQEPRYLFHSVEAQIRSLAEVAAMLQDYDLAISSYKLLIPDLK